MTHRALDLGVAVPPGRGDMLGQLAAGIALYFKGVLDIFHNGSAGFILHGFPSMAQFFPLKGISGAGGAPLPSASLPGRHFIFPRLPSPLLPMFAFWNTAPDLGMVGAAGIYHD